MLIELDDSILARLDRDDGTRGRAVQALENIAHTRRNGHHVLTGSRDIFEALSQHDAIGQRARELYRRIGARQSQKGALRQTVSTFARVLGVGFLGRTERCITIPLDTFVRDELSNSAILLCENRTDCRIHKRFGETYAHTVGLGQVSIRLEERTGGGSTIAVEYRSFLDAANRLCLAIADTDKDSPDCADGRTLAALRKADKDDQPLCCIADTVGRTAENLVPTEVLKQGLRQPSAFSRHILLLDRLESSKAVEGRFFLDLKKGMNYECLLGMLPGVCHKNFWEKHIEELVTVSEPDPECYENDRCQSPGSCRCPVLEPFENGLLERCAAVLERIRVNDVLTLLNKLPGHPAIKVGENVFAWGCDGRPLRVT